MQKQSPLSHKPSTPQLPFQFNQSHKQLNLSEGRFRKAFVTHLKTSKSISYETNNPDESTHQQTKDYQKVLLKTQKQLSKLHFSLDTLNHHENKLLLPTIHNFSSLSSLNMEISGNFHYDSILREMLSKSLSSLKNLTHLDLFFGSMIFSDLRIIKKLMKTLRKLRKISSLSLTFYSCYGQTPSHYNILFSNLVKMTQLRRLTLKFDNSEDLDILEIEIFASFLSKLSFLTQLDLTFEGSWTFQEPTLLQFFGAFRNMKNLTDLALDLKGCKFAYYYYETGSILESLKCLIGTSITKFSLSLFQNFDSSNLQELSSVLKQLNLLQSFSLDFSTRSILQEERFTYFGSAFTCLVSLRSLCLSFPYGAVSKNVVQTTATALMFLQNLVSLKLEFKADNATEDEHFQTLFANLKYLKSLKYLDIQVVDQDEITDNSLEVLGKSLKELNHLKELSLGFTLVPFLTNQGLEAICSAIQENLSNLFCLSLIFEKNRNINDKVMSRLVGVLQGLPLLYSVELCFSRCIHLKDCKDLFHVLRRMETLEEIKLSLPYSKENLLDVGELQKVKNVIYFELC